VFRVKYNQGKNLKKNHLNIR